MFGQYGLALAKQEFPAVDGYRLIAAADQVHFDATELLAVNRAMAICIQIEICAELAVDSSQDIQIELRGYPASVVICGFDNVPLFAQIDADQQSTVLTCFLIHDPQ